MKNEDILLDDILDMILKELENEEQNDLIDDSYEVATIRVEHKR